MADSLVWLLFAMVARWIWSVSMLVEVYSKAKDLPCGMSPGWQKGGCSHASTQSSDGVWG